MFVSLPMPGSTFQLHSLKRHRSCSTLLGITEANADVYVAEALLQSMLLPETENKVYAVTSTEGEGPGTDKKKWKALFKAS